MGAIGRGCGVIAAGAVTALALGACGSSSGGAGAASRAAAPARGRGRFPVAVTVARFAGRQELAGRVRLTLAVRDTGTRALPDVAVTICETSCAPSDRSNEGTASQAFGEDIPAAPNTADPSRPLWIVNRGPGGCHLGCNAPGGDLGGGVTASSNTWALGRLAPGATARFSWELTPVVAGRHRVAWEVAGDPSGGARAVDAGGRVPSGAFSVAVGSAPPTVRVTPAGRVVTTSAG